MKPSAKIQLFFEYDRNLYTLVKISHDKYKLLSFFLLIDKNLRIFAPLNITIMHDNLHIEEMRNALGNKTEITIRDIDDFYCRYSPDLCSGVLT